MVMVDDSTLGGLTPAQGGCHPPFSLHLCLGCSVFKRNLTEVISGRKLSSVLKSFNG